MPVMTRLTARGRALRIARTIDGRSRDDLADAAGVSRLRVHLIETGKIQPTAEELARLWEALVAGPSQDNTEPSRR